MKPFMKMYKPHILRPIIYKLIPRLLTGLALALLWDRFFNTQKLFPMVEYPFFVLGIIFFAMAWVVYLKLDGMKIHHLNENRKKIKHKLEFPIDFSDEEPSPTDSLDENEDATATLLSNILAGICFLLPSVLSLLFGK